MIATLIALAVGLAFGAVVQRTHFCTMGAIADVALFRSLRRAKGWLLALAVAMAATQAAMATGWLRLDDGPYGWSAIPWAAAVSGGVAFGFGMVLAGGCISRNLARAGAGSLKAVVTLVLAATVGAVTLAVMATPTASTFLRGLDVDLSGPVATTIRGITGLGVALAMGLYCVADRRLRQNPRELWGGIAIGSLVPVAWFAGHYATAPSAAGGLTFAIPLASTLASATQPPLSLPGFAAGLVGGAIAGAHGMARLDRQLRIETFTGSSDMIRHLVGGVLMGVGGSLAGGCTVGHGITGLAALAPVSALAVGGMIVGCLWALRWLETGRLLSARRSPPAGTGPSLSAR